MKEHLDRIEPALKEGGGRLHAFLSGGGLRVVRVDDGKIDAYGEHPTLDEAFRILVDDYEAGGRPYGDVYGKVEDHYLTGQSQPVNELDAWVRRGSTFDATYADGRFQFEMRGFGEFHTPQDTVERCTAGETIEWTTGRGVTYRCSPSRFPNGEKCCSTQAVKIPPNMAHHRVWMWRSKRTGWGNTLQEAIACALVAPSVEVDDV